MFCPKCGSNNIETVNFCRQCGAELEAVAKVMTGKLKKSKTSVDSFTGETISNNPDDIWASAIRNLLMGVGFFIISMALLFTGVAGGKAWWWAMLFPAFSMIAMGISQWARVKRIDKQQNVGFSGQTQNSLNEQPVNSYLPPTNTENVSLPKSIYDTGEIVIPPSVTENTTRHLEINKEGETMTLPKRD